MKTSSAEKAPNNQNNNYFELKIPRISFTNFHVNPYFLLIVIAISFFFMGMLTNKILYLQSISGQTNTQTGTISNTQQVNGDNTFQYPTAPPDEVDVEIGHLPTLGSDDAKVTIVEFSDIQCPFCKKYKEETYPELFDEYINTGKVRYAFRHFPLTNIHPNAQKAGEAVECANEQNNFWELHDLLFDNQSNWAELSQDRATDAFVDYASELGIDTDQFRSCLETDKYANDVTEDLKAGASIGVDGTPAFFINGRRLTGAQPFDQFKKIIDEELNK